MYALREVAAPVFPSKRDRKRNKFNWWPLCRVVRFQQYNWPYDPLVTNVDCRVKWSAWRHEAFRVWFNSDIRTVKTHTDVYLNVSYLLVTPYFCSCRYVDKRYTHETMRGIRDRPNHSLKSHCWSAEMAAYISLSVLNFCQSRFVPYFPKSGWSTPSIWNVDALKHFVAWN